MKSLIHASDWGPSIWDSFAPLNSRFGDPDVRADSQPDVIYPAWDIKESDAAYMIVTDLPGITKDDLEVTVKDGVLTVAAQTVAEDSEESDGRVIRQERRQGRYVRSLRFGEVIDDSKIEAQFKNGVLSLTLPKKEEAHPRKIEVAVQ